MALLDTAYRAREKVRRTVTREQYVSPIDKFAGVAPAPSEGDGPLTRQFLAHQGRTVHKWMHYLPFYERHLGTRVGTDVHMLEIGVFKGGSLQLWRDYLGPQAVIRGLDIDPACAGYGENVHIGSQDDPAFLAGVVESMGRLDVVLDDGSHIGRHQIASFNALWPRLSEGGIYMIEDMHTAYWPGDMEGGYRRPGTGIEFVKTLIDDLHHWYHDRGGLTDIGEISMRDSIVAIEKRAPVRPMHVKVPH